MRRQLKRNQYEVSVPKKDEVAIQARGHTSRWWQSNSKNEVAAH